MKQIELKHQLKAQLETKGFEFRLREYSVDTYIARRNIGIFTVWIILSNNARVLVETSGTGSYFINVVEYRKAFKEITAKDIETIFKRYESACISFNKLSL